MHDFSNGLKLSTKVLLKLPLLYKNVTWLRLWWLGKSVMLQIVLNLLKHLKLANAQALWCQIYQKVPFYDYLDPTMIVPTVIKAHLVIEVQLNWTWSALNFSKSTWMSIDNQSSVQAVIKIHFFQTYFARQRGYVAPKQDPT